MKTVIIYSLGAAFLLGFADCLRRVGIVRLESTLFGAVIQNFTSWVTCLLVLIITERNCGEMFPKIDMKGGVIIGIVGILVGLAVWLLMNAFKIGEVKIAAPIASVYPVFAVLLAVLFLGEQLTLTKAVGILVTICGVILVTR